MIRVLDEWGLTAERLAVHLPTGTAVAADLHLGYAGARRRRGEAVPADDRDGLGGLFRAVAAVRARLDVRRLVVAGDLLEDASGLELLPGLPRALEERGVILAGVVPGNHDRGLERVPSLPLFPQGFALGDWQVVHGDGPRPAGPYVAGHLHPCLRWGRLAAPCFLVGPRSLVLPAFSPDAAGVNVRGRAAWRGFRAVAVAGTGLLDFGDIVRLGKIGPSATTSP